MSRGLPERLDVFVLGNDDYVISVLILFIKSYACIVGTHLNYFDKFVKVYVSGTHLNCLDLSRQFK